MSKARNNANKAAVKAATPKATKAAEAAIAATAASTVAADAVAAGDAAANAAEAAMPKPTREMENGTVPAAKSLKIEKDRPRANGYTRPSIGGICRTIWDACDAILASGQPMPTAKQLAAQLGVNVSTVGRQSAEWRKYKGLAPKRGAAATTQE